MMVIGFAITEHCNLRCPHCIRDDVTTYRALDLSLIERVIDDAGRLFGPVAVSLTGGEPLIHERFRDIVDLCAARSLPYRFVTNGWHMQRTMPILDRYAPQAVRVSLSGADEAVHDAERGRGSFRRVLQAVALLTSRRIPTVLSIVVDRRDRHQLREAAALAEALGVLRIQFILPQPVPGSALRDSDLPPAEWESVRDEIDAIAAASRSRTEITLDYGAPLRATDGECSTMSHERIYVNARGQLSLCCQLSEYGFNTTDVVGDLNEESLLEIYPRYLGQLAELKANRAVEAAIATPYSKLPCINCARGAGKLAWLKDFPESAWHEAGQHLVAT
jgi:MoaA/NifB/PqqE/SkfB family radical SAM enzyme